MKEEQLEQFKTFFQDLLEQWDESKNTPHNGEEQQVDRVTRGDDGDRATDEREKFLYLKLQAREGLYRRKVEEALERIEEGHFGECQDCGANISFERLSARPTATLCISCKEEQENQEEHIPYQKRSHTLGKEIVSGSQSA